MNTATYVFENSRMLKSYMPNKPSLTSPKIKKLAGKGLKAPSTLTTKETQELAASVMEHIQRHGRPKPKQ